MSDSNDSPTAAVLIIGNEILSGRTQDVNLNTIARKMQAMGVILSEARVVPDVEAEIIAALNALRTRYTYVFTTGGIGPTHDDITVASVAKAFNVPVVEDAEARRRLTAYYTENNLNAARLRMALVPQGASLIDNPVSGAPGFKIDNVYVMAGVPRIMEAMLGSVASTLASGAPIFTVTISGAIGESLIADELAAIAHQYSSLDIGSYPTFRMGQISTALVVRGTDEAAVNGAADTLVALMKAHKVQPLRE